LRGESGTEGASEPRRSLPVFDPVAGMRAMADIQGEGLRAASEILDRILRSEPEGNGNGRAPRRANADYAAVVDAWAELFRRMVAGFTEPVQPGAVTVPIDGNEVGPLIRLSPRETEAGGATTEVWLHNGTSSPAGPLAMHCGPLTAGDGTVLEGAEVSFDPHEVALLPQRSSRGVVVAVAVTGSPRPGSYRGTIQCDGAPELWLPLEVVI
jgi:hypothetical protein